MLKQRIPCVFMYLNPLVLTYCVAESQRIFLEDQMILRITEEGSSLPTQAYFRLSTAGNTSAFAG